MTAVRSSVPLWASAMRLHQWLKNLLIFVPLLVSHRLGTPGALTDGIVAFVLFGLCASSAYMLNDLVDLASDRRHPSKSRRPLAAGLISMRAARVAVPVLLACAFAGAIWWLPWQFTVAMATYYVVTVTYSLWLKRLMMVDVVTLAMLYTLRIIAGTLLFHLVMTFWMLAFSMFIFLSLALVKRYAELLGARNRGDTTRPGGRGYYADDLGMIASLGAASGYLSVMVLALYIQDPNTAALYGNPRVIWLACPLLMYWVSRVWVLTHRGEMNDDPVVFAIRDRVSLLVGGLFGLVFLAGRMIDKGLNSWGRYPAFPQLGHPIYWLDNVPRALADTNAMPPVLAYGCGRSYGDTCMAVSDQVLAMRGVNRLISADWNSGLIVAEAGLTLAELIRIALPRGWFLNVTPGTKIVTLGGAVANDVHGKNHHVTGTFGCHVRKLTLHRTVEGTVTASRDERPELFAATVGGLGLTGIILTVEMQLKRVVSGDVEQCSTRFGSLDEFFDLSNAQDREHEYTVAWIDCVATGKKSGRGFFVTGRHCATGDLTVGRSEAWRFPIDPGVSLVNPATVRAFNAIYYRRQLRKRVMRRVGYDAFFYPLDRVSTWNRIYGRAGFQQYQCVVPQSSGREVIRAALGEIARSGTGSFLAVLKQCGTQPSPGLMSFPMHGVSLALDFPQRAEVNRRLFANLDELVHEAGGRLYPAKDAHMSAAHFQKAYPEWQRVEALRDPRLMSRFWQRVTR